MNENKTTLEDIINDNRWKVKEATNKKTGVYILAFKTITGHKRERYEEIVNPIQLEKLLTEARKN